MTTTKTTPPPRHLSKSARRIWCSLMEDFQLDDEAAKFILTNCLEAWDRLEEARRALKRDGITVKDRWGVPKAHPATLIESSARSQLFAGLRLLRLAPDALEGR